VELGGFEPPTSWVRFTLSGRENRGETGPFAGYSRGLANRRKCRIPADMGRFSAFRALLATSASLSASVRAPCTSRATLPIVPSRPQRSSFFPADLRRSIDKTAVDSSACLPADRIRFCLAPAAWDELVAAMDRPARPNPRLARLFSCRRPG
jgi:hypothetical protein